MWVLGPISSFKGLQQQGLNQLGALHPKGFPSIFPMSNTFVKSWKLGGASALIATHGSQLVGALTEKLHAE